MSYFGVVKLQSATSETSATYSNTGGEQTVFEYTPTTRVLLLGAWLDLNAMTKNGTVKMYYKIDGTNYREVDSQTFTYGTSSPGFFINVQFPISHAFKITYTEVTDEGADRSVPYSYYYALYE